jgi:hypothetical protein
MNGSYTWGDYVLAAERCLATAEQLRAWCHRTGKTLENAVCLANVGGLGPDESVHA